MSQTAGEDDVKKLWSMIKDTRFAMMTTQNEAGHLHARPMATLAHAGFDDATLWFFTRLDSGKVDELQADRHVNLAYSDPSHQNYVSVAGIGSVVRDREKIHHLWREILATWFPKGVDDPQLGLLKVKVESAAYWDSPSGAMVYAYGYVKAKLTGEPPRPGDHKRVSFQ